MTPPSRCGVSAAAAAAAATALCCSSCGNFVVVGYADGRMHKFNLQSCLHRGEFLRSSSSSRKQQQGVEKAHKGSVCGVSMMGASVVISASSDPEVRRKEDTAAAAAQPLLCFGLARPP